MKVVNFIVEIISILVYLTVGSFLIIVAVHLVGFEDAINAITDIYKNPIHSLETGGVGLIFIVIGLTLAKIVVKRGRSDDALMLEGTAGKIRISVDAIEDIARKVLKKFLLIKEYRVRTHISDRHLEIKIRLVLWAGGNIPSLVNELNAELSNRLTKVLGLKDDIEIKVDVAKVLENEQIDELQGVK
ncbi:MAG: alkaline shock response membrane anchor protein AmaP [Candidatus Omnitrophica bacterium]|nr:alkaline shock response membrane anchor protein AmaP [Candidatus Omnitrophota bacterium]